MSIRIAETSELSLDTEDLLKQLLLQVDTEEIGDNSTEESEGATTILLEVELDGARYTLTRFSSVASSDVSLSPREQEIVRLVAKGLSNKAIATVLEISFWTVATHLRRIFTKLGVGSRAEMITKALQEGLLNS
jgi:two-component system, NarL family, nitrate/nitrite response regulator NarL